jgi:hypothetical protein
MTDKICEGNRSPNLVDAPDYVLHVGEWGTWFLICSAMEDLSLRLE